MQSTVTPNARKTDGAGSHSRKPSAPAPPAGAQSAPPGMPGTPAEPQVVMVPAVLDCEATDELDALVRKLDEASKLACAYLEKHERKCGRGGCSCPMCVQFPGIRGVVDAVETVVSVQSNLLDNLRPLSSTDYEE